MYISPESELGIELAKWNKPYVYKEFPRMVYKAYARDNGKVLCGDPADEGFTRACQRTVQSEDELRQARTQGWAVSPEDALEQYEAGQRTIAEAAAEANHAAQRMTPKAQDERKKRDAATDKHVPE
jgi:hypothetical protein